MLSGHDFLMAVAQVDNLDPSQTTTLTVCIDSAKTVLVPAELYSPEMNEGYMAVNVFGYEESQYRRKEAPDKVGHGRDKQSQG